jgi:hypothetical protein
MSDSISGLSAIHASMSHTGRVDKIARVESVQEMHLDALHPADEIAEVAQRAPLAETISLADIDRFRGIVYASPVGSVEWAAFASKGHSTTEPPVTGAEYTTPADRIAGTLAHIRGIRGL